LSREKLIGKFQELPNLNGDVFNEKSATNFDFPRFRHPQKKLSGEPIGISRKKEISELPNSLPRAKLQVAIEKATRKLQFLDVTLDQWENELIYTQDSLSPGPEYNLTRSSIRKWNEGEAINLSSDSLQDWFKRVFINRIVEGGIESHTQVLVGSAGSGKSTLIKYSIIKNFEYLQQNNIVPSRFEFFKFVTLRKKGLDDEKAIADYVSFIHARDLIIHHFLSTKNGVDLLPKDHFESEGYAVEVDRIIECVPDNANLLGYTSNIDYITRKIRSILYEARNGNRAIMDALNDVSHDVKIVLIAILSEGKTLLTIFDGLDSVKAEDAFDDTTNWHLACKIIDQRHRYSNHKEFEELSIYKKTDSLIITRKNTLEMLVKGVNLPNNMDIVTFGFIHTVDNIDGFAAIAGVTKRVKRNLHALETGDQVETSLEEDAFVQNMMSFIDRTMRAICANKDKPGKIEYMYGFFDGNLRELFKFILQIFNWSIAQMEGKNILQPEDYGTNVWLLMSAISTESGEQFFRWKGYRIIELLLLSNRDWYENMITMPVSKSKLARVKPRLKTTTEYSGRIDNVFNYLDRNQDTKIDCHSIFEKIRIIQILMVADRSTEMIEHRLENTFGYSPKDTDITLLHLIKTRFVSANVVTLENGDIDVLYSATNRAKLALTSLIFNMAYLEHIFHKTLFPTVMIQGITGRPRTKNLFEWILGGIRNVYVMLSYLEMVENNPCNGKSVPNQYKIVEQMRKSILDSIERITASKSEDEDEDTDDYPEIDKSTLCEMAFKRVTNTETKWKNHGLL